MILDAKGRELHVGDKVRFATWGMFGIWVEECRRNRKEDDPQYVTHTELGRVDELLHEKDGSILIRPAGVIGVIYMCTKPEWGARPEFVEIITD